MKRRRHHNGIITGYRPQERWWIGGRHNFACDQWEANLLGLTILIPAELLTRQTTTYQMTHRTREES